MKQTIPFWTVQVSFYRSCSEICALTLPSDQVWLYLYGSLFALVLVFLGADGTTTIMPGTELSNCIGRTAVAVVTGATGLVVANILRKSDNLVKLIGGSATVVTTLVIQPILFPELWEQSFNSVTILAVGIITLSTWTYNFYKDQSPMQSILLPPSPVNEKKRHFNSPNESEVDLSRVDIDDSMFWETSLIMYLLILFRFARFRS